MSFPIHEKTSPNHAPPRNNYFSLFYYDCVGKNRGTVVYSFMKKMGLTREQALDTTGFPSYNLSVNNIEKSYKKRVRRRDERTASRVWCEPIPVVLFGKSLLGVSRLRAEQ
jgi:hypothetical protein